MKNYTKPDGSLWAFESDGSQDALITTDMKPISDAELKALQAAYIPCSVTMRQARLALLESGLLARVESAISGLQGQARDVARIEWEYAVTVDRSSHLTTLLGSALGLDSAALDALFSRAAVL